MVRFCCSVKPSQLWWGLPHPHHQLDFPHYPSKIANTLASPRKRGGGLTALQNRYSASSSFCNLSDCFQNYYTFCRQDGGDCFPLAQSLRCYPLTFKMVRFCCSVKPSQLWWGLPHPHHQLDFPHHPSKIANTLALHCTITLASPRKRGGVLTASQNRYST